jgi:hypothetical protein
VTLLRTFAEAPQRVHGKQAIQPIAHHDSVVVALTKKRAPILLMA